MNRYLILAKLKELGKKSLLVLKKTCFPLQVILSYLPKVLGFYLIFLAVFLIFPPLFRHEVPPLADCQQELEQRFGWSSERVLPLETVNEAELWRFKLLNEAQDSIDMAIFDYRDDQAGQAFTSILLKAADRGAHVRLLVDGSSSTLLGHFFPLVASHPNVEVRIYNPVHPLQPWNLNYRMHEKFILVDDQLYLLGGRNQNSLFIGDYDDVPRKNQDRDLVVYTEEPDKASSHFQLQEYFDVIWDLDKVKAVDPFVDKNDKARAEHEEFDQHMADLEREIAQRLPEAFAPCDWAKETLPAKRVELVAGLPTAANKPPLVFQDLVDRMGEGHDVIIETPYLMLSSQHYQQLADLEAKEGVHVSYLTNSPECGANIFGTAEQLFRRNRLTDMGSDLYEYIGEKSQHTKTILIDDNISMVGSFNFDLRSIYLDTENMVWVDSPELNAFLRKQAQEQVASSRKITPDGTWTYGPDCQETQLSVGKTIALALVHIFSLPIHHLL